MNITKWIILLLLIFSIMFACSKKTTESEGQCEVPVFSPGGGYYVVGQTVTMTSPTSGATIHYTLDGTIPTHTSLLYSAPIAIDSVTFIRAIATKPDWEDSEEASAMFTIQLTSELMVWLPGGTITMGRTSGTGNADELPAHQVTISPFYIGKYEVSQIVWQSIMDSNPSHNTGDTFRPVEQVSWYAVLVYCNKLSITEGKTPVYKINNSTEPTDWGEIPVAYDAIWEAVFCDWTADGYRLPTEAEWEYAARGGVNTPDYLYAGSDSLEEVGWYNSNSDNTTHPIGQLQMNGVGLFDLSGNVLEWCWDKYADDYYDSSPVSNPTGPVTGLSHVYRGGSFNNNGSFCRVAGRLSNSGSFSAANTGFRIVCKAD